jgi:hypothetical protein
MQVIIIIRRRRRRNITHLIIISNCFIIDLIVLDINFTFQSIISTYSWANLIASKDVNNLINTGCLIIRNHLSNQQLLQSWLSYRHDPGIVNEQLGFDRLYSQLLMTNHATVSKIVILPAHILNSIAPPMLQQEDTHQVKIISITINYIYNIYIYIYKDIASRSRIG